MATPFKIPKKTRSDRDDVQMLSPLSRFQDANSHFKTSNWNSHNEGQRHKYHSVNGHSSRTESGSTPNKQTFREVVKARLEFRHPMRSNPTQPTAYQKSEATRQGDTKLKTPELQKRWRPKRASDRLCHDENQTVSLSPQKKTHRSGLNDSSMSLQSSSVDSDSEDSGPELPEETPCSSRIRVPSGATSLGEAAWRKQNLRTNGTLAQSTEVDKITGKLPTSDLGRNGIRTDTRCGTLTSGTFRTPASASPHSGRSSDSSSPARLTSLSATQSPLPQKAAPCKPGDWRARRERGVQRERDQGVEPKHHSLHLTHKRTNPASSEPIVLSSDEDAEAESGAGQPLYPTPPPGEHTQPPPPILELPFVTLHAGWVRAEANGNITITDDGITLPLKDPGSGREGEGISVSLVASQLRGYGVWEGALALSGSLLHGWEGPAPSLLFLWVSHAQAALIQTELSAIHPVSSSGQPCPFLLLVLQDQLGDHQAALLASMLVEEAFRLGIGSPLSWADGLALIHSCPQEEQLLALLGQDSPTRPEDRPAPTTVQDGLSRLKSNRSREFDSRTSFRLQGPATRLIQYPLAPSKGRITVTTEDLECLGSGQFLNDVIIDFYLKYLLLERGAKLAERCHIFSSFFYKQLTRCDVAGEEAAGVLPRNRRHQRVKTWTRHVDIFNKDFLFVPVNHEAHWYLVIICFPGLEEVRLTPWSQPAAAGGRLKASGGGSPGGSALPSSTPERGAGCIRPNPGIYGSHNPPECTQDGCQRETICKRPCILVMDSLKLSYHDRIFKLLREYLQVEWEVRRGTPREFTADSIKSSHCRVPLQDNSSDCGLYLLQYVETFLQNPVVHFDLPVRLEHWFPRQRVWRKREEIRRLVMQLHSCQGDQKGRNG